MYWGWVRDTRYSVSAYCLYWGGRKWTYKKVKPDILKGFPVYKFWLAGYLDGKFTDEDVNDLPDNIKTQREG